jgi:hypothetical protein
MSILFGTLSLFLSIFLPVLILFITGFQIMSFSLFFIIPVGALAIGYLCGYGYFKGLVKSNTYILRKHFLIGIILSFVCIIGIKYATYSLTCLDPETYDIVYSLDGDHVSNYEVDGYGQMNFLNYTIFMIETTPISFSYKAQSIGEVSNPIASWIFALIDFLGVSLGAMVAGSNQKDNPYCHRCQLYKKKKDIIKVPKAEGTRFFEELENSVAKADMGESTKALISNFNIDQSLEKEEHFLGKLIYCESCHKASLDFEYHQFNSKKKLEKNPDYKHTVDVNYSIIDSPINKLYAI